MADPFVAAELTPEAFTGEPAARSAQPWPPARLAWYAVAMLALSLALQELDRGIMNLLVGPIKTDLHLTDSEMGLLLGFATAVFFAAIGLPAARLIDTRRRTLILSIGIAVWSASTALCGLAQSFVQLFLCRMGVGAGQAPHGPGCYSILADYFPRDRLPRAIAVLQIGYIAGTGFSLILGAMVIQAIAGLPPAHLGSLVIHNWQMVFLAVGLPGLIVAALVGSVPEPPRRGRVSTGKKINVPIRAVVAMLVQNRTVYGPLFLALLFSIVDTLGTQVWRPEFFRRTYGWSPQQVGYIFGVASLIAAPIGLLVGTAITERLVKRHEDGHVRAVAIFFTSYVPFAIAAPLMPNPWAAIVCSAIAYALGMASAVPQNAAIQSVTPNEMRGQVTALYLFIFTAIGGGLGPSFIAFLTDHVVGNEQLIRYSFVISGATMGPLAALSIWLGVRPYGRKLAEVKAHEVAGHVH